jgi:hypothetical protein
MTPAPTMTMFLTIALWKSFEMFDVVMSRRGKRKMGSFALPAASTPLASPLGTNDDTVDENASKIKQQY